MSLKQSTDKIWELHLSLCILSWKLAVIITFPSPCLDFKHSNTVRWSRAASTRCWTDSLRTLCKGPGPKASGRVETLLGSRRGPARPAWGGITNIVTSAGPEAPGGSGDFLGELSTAGSYTVREVTRLDIICQRMRLSGMLAILAWQLHRMKY